MGDDNKNIQEIKDLIVRLNYLTKKYDEGNPEVSDKEWDDMYFHLVKMEQLTGCYFPDSPTQRVNYDVKNKLNKVTHSHLMLSLDKTKSIDEVKAFIGNRAYIAMAKMDGLTCSLTYRGGRLVSAETRGNGEVGEDILHNALVVKNIPNRINFQDELVVDGEIICTYPNFKEFADEYKNPRNFASGSIRLLDSAECAKRNLSFIAWDCIKGLDDKEYLSEKLVKLDALGFEIVPFQADDQKLFNIEKIIEWLKKVCENELPIDGVVIKYDKISTYEQAGLTDHHFKGGLAYKFYDDEYDTVLRDITYDIGRTGVLTPVAIFDPVDIDGTECSRASLHNISVLEETLHGSGWQGQKIKVFKANQIIPQISWAEEDNEYTKYYISHPMVCPICNKPTIIKENNGVKILICGNENCEGKLLNRFDHFCSKKGLDIKGLSKATLEKLMDWEWLNTYQDIFLLWQVRDKWIQKPGFGEASVDKILNAIAKVKENVKLEQVIAAAGIPEIGSRIAKDLAKHYDSWADFRAETNFLKYDGIGEVMNNNLLNFDYDDLNLDYTVNLHLKAGIENSKQEETNQTTSTIVNKVFCITGKVHIFKNRSVLQADIESKGGRVVSSMSSKVNYLINNDSTSTSAKNKAAQAAGIPIITEEEYMEMTNL